MHYNPYIYPYQYLYYVNVPIPMYNYGRQSVYCTFPNEIDYTNRFDFFASSMVQRTISLQIMDQNHLLLISMKQLNKTIPIVLLYGQEHIYKLL